ncbi:uncharacterized protein LOC128389562 [Panonychus citri]|uniref:uncharacterized protein LOC128389562 n=1 Tax=Panonychus citri TaxID=50023 RepID=UPI0023077D24|nr:uncharacterized protein LOC128389562 [Panonychus citri]
MDPIDDYDLLPQEERLTKRLALFKNYKLEQFREELINWPTSKKQQYINDITILIDPVHRETYKIGRNKWFMLCAFKKAMEADLEPKDQQVIIEQIPEIIENFQPSPLNEQSNIIIDPIQSSIILEPILEFEIANDMEQHTSNKRKSDQEIKNINSKRLNNNQSLEIPSTWLPWTNNLMKPMAILTCDSSHEALFEQIVNLTNEGELLLEMVNGIHKTKNGVKIICFDNESLNNSINNITNIINNIKIDKIKPKLPKIKIQRVPFKESTAETILNKLISMNPFLRNEFTSVHRLFIDQKGSKDIILNVSPAVRSLIQERMGLINAGLSSIRAKDFFEIAYCTNCHELTHYKGSCSNQTRCRFCGGSHSFKFCAEKSNKEKICCSTCGIKGHFPITSTCLPFMKKIEIEASKVEFSYQYLMF